jgi:hypothetical protein
MGSLDEDNRTDNLQQFKDLLHRIIRRWPEVEFIRTDELGDLIAERHGGH